MPPMIFLDHPASRVALAVPGPEHAKLLATWLNDPDARQMLLRFAPMSVAAEEKWLADVAAGAAQQHRMSEAVFLIVEKACGEAVGCIGLHGIDWKNRHAWTGISIGSEGKRSNGLGTDAYMLLLDWAFNELGLASVEAHVIAYNERSLHCHRKCGYKEVGRLRQRHFRFGSYHDGVLLDLLADEWRTVWQRFPQGAASAPPTEARRAGRGPVAPTASRRLETTEPS